MRQIGSWRVCLAFQHIQAKWEKSVCGSVIGKQGCHLLILRESWERVVRASHLNHKGLFFVVSCFLEHKWLEGFFPAFGVCQDRELRSSSTLSQRRQGTGNETPNLQSVFLQLCAGARVTPEPQSWSPPQPPGTLWTGLESWFLTVCVMPKPASGRVSRPSVYRENLSTKAMTGWG